MPPVLAEPVPVMVKPAVEPVLFRTMPFAPPVAEIFWKVKPLAPMFVFVTFNAGPVGGVVPPIVLVPVTFSVVLLPEAPVALKTELAPFSVIPALKLIVVLVLLLSRMPVPVSVIAPVKATVPPV